MQVIAGKFKGVRLEAPKGEATRPTTGMVREALFNICQQEVEGADFLDLFAGSGLMGIEALSRGASSATFVESSRKAVFTLRKNLQKLKALDQSKVIEGDVFRYLKTLEKSKKFFDLIYVDPPYEKEFSLKVLEFLDEHSLLKPGGRVFIEEESKVSLPIKNLQNLEFIRHRKFGRSTIWEFQ